MQVNDEATVKTLLATARDETKPAEERYAAVRHACKLRGDVYEHVPLEHLRFVAAGMQAFLGLKPLAMKGAAEAVASGFARRTTPQPHH